MPLGTSTTDSSGNTTAPIVFKVPDGVPGPALLIAEDNLSRYPVNAPFELLGPMPGPGTFG